MLAGLLPALQVWGGCDQLSSDLSQLALNRPGTFSAFGTLALLMWLRSHDFGAPPLFYNDPPPPRASHRHSDKPQLPSYVWVGC